QMRAAVRVVLDAFHFRRDTVLVATEIDLAIVLLVATAHVARGDTAAVVATGGFRLLLQQRRVRLALVQAGGYHLDQRTATGGGRLNFYQGHDLLRRVEVDVAAFGQADVRLLPVVAPTGEAAETLFFAFDVRDAHALHLDLLVLGREQQFDRRLDFRLGRI